MNAQREDVRRPRSSRAAKVIDAAECVTLALPREPRRRRARLDAGAAPRAARRGPRQRRVVPRAVRDRAALPRPAGPRPADAAGGVPRRPVRWWSRSTAARSAGSATCGRSASRRTSSSSSTTTSRTSGTARSTSSIPHAAASGVVVRRLIARLGLRSMTRDSAVCLYTALVCDTGRFQYETTTPRGVRARRRARRVRRPGRARSAARCSRSTRFAYLAAARRGARGDDARPRAVVRVDGGDPGACWPATA